MNRRQVVESANAALKGSFVDCARGFFRVFGRVKISVLLGFTVAAYNLDRIRSFRANQLELASAAEAPAEEKAGHLGRGARAIRESALDQAGDRPARLSTAASQKPPLGAVLARPGFGRSDVQCPRLYQ